MRRRRWRTVPVVPVPQHRGPRTVPEFVALFRHLTRLVDDAAQPAAVRLDALARLGYLAGLDTITPDWTRPLGASTKELDA
jgi:hypothetical protein